MNCIRSERYRYHASIYLGERVGPRVAEPPLRSLARCGLPSHVHGTTATRR